MTLGQRFRKGNMGFDILTLLIAIFIFAAVIFFLYIIQNDVNAEVQADDEIPQVVKDESQTQTERYVSIFDDGFFFFFVLLWMALIVTSFFIDTHPVFFIITCMLMFFIVIFAAGMSNYFQELVMDEEFADTIDFPNTFPKIYFVITHLVQFTIAIFATTSLALWGKNRTG